MIQIHPTNAVFQVRESQRLPKYVNNDTIVEVLSEKKGDEGKVLLRFTARDFRRRFEG